MRGKGRSAVEPRLTKGAICFARKFATITGRGLGDAGGCKAPVGGTTFSIVELVTALVQGVSLAPLAEVEATEVRVVAEVAEPAGSGLAADFCSLVKIMEIWPFSVFNA